MFISGLPLRAMVEVNAVSRVAVDVWAYPREMQQQVGSLTAGQRVLVIARTHDSLWVRVRASDGTDGWVLSGKLEYDAGFMLDMLPASEPLSDRPMAQGQPVEIALLNLFPVVPVSIHENMWAVFRRGQELGRQANVVTKIGDSVIANELYLIPLSGPEAALGPYAYLEPTRLIFGAGMSESVAARQGLTSATVFDPFWADKEYCAAGESPLACEYRLKQPAIVFVMFGYNDILALSPEEFQTQLQLIIEESLISGVVPVLVTFSSHPESPLWQDSLTYNALIIDTATRYHVPLINLWLASRPLPRYGLERDYIHLKNSGYGYLDYTQGQETTSGVALLNLLSLQVLYELQETVYSQSPDALGF